MHGVEKRSFDSPDETRTPAKGVIAVVTVGEVTVGRKTLEPGWRWSECIKAIAGTDDCQLHHLGVALSGRLRVTHRDGSVADLGPGDVYVIQAGHDALVLGDQPFVGVEFDSGTASTYGRTKE